MTFRRIPPRLVRRTVSAIDRYFLRPRRQKVLHAYLGVDDTVTKIDKARAQHKPVAPHATTLQERLHARMAQEIGMGGESEARHG